MNGEQVHMLNHIYTGYVIQYCSTSCADFAHFPDQLSINILCLYSFLQLSSIAMCTNSTPKYGQGLHEVTIVCHIKRPILLIEDAMIRQFDRVEPQIKTHHVFRLTH